MFYHVVVSISGSDTNEELLFSDLSKAELKRRFLNSYKNGKDIFVNKKILSTKDINSISITLTKQTSKNTLVNVRNEADRNPDSMLSLIGALGSLDPASIIHHGADVTDIFIKSPPGTGTVNHNFLKFLNSSWVLRIVGGGLLIFIGVVAKDLWTTL